MKLQIEVPSPFGNLRQYVERSKANHSSYALTQAILTNNHFSNTKYVLNAINLHATPTPPGKELNRDIKLKMNKAKTYYDMGEIFSISKEEIEKLEKEGTVEELKGMVPRWTKRAEEIEKSEGVVEVEDKK